MKKLILFLAFSLLTSQAFAENKKAVAEVPTKQVVTASFANTIEDLMPSVVNIAAIQEVPNSNVTVDQAILGELPNIF